MATRQWDEAAPAGSSPFRSGDNEIRDTKRDIRERGSQGGHIWNTAALDEEGRHAIDAGGAGVGPHIFKADGSTKLLDFQSNTIAELAASWLWRGAGSAVTKNFDPTLMADDIVGIDAKGYKRTLQPFRIYESATPNTLVNIAPGLRRSSMTSAYFAGGTLTIGTSPLLRPVTALHHINYIIYLDSAGTLSARAGSASDIYANNPPEPQPLAGETFICIIRIRNLSVNFSLETAGENAYLLRDGRVDLEPSVSGVLAAGSSSGSGGAPNSVTIATESITARGIVLIIASAIYADTYDIGIKRDGALISGQLNAFGSYSETFIDSPTVGAHTYTFTRGAGTAPSRYRFYVLDLGTSTLA